MTPPVPWTGRRPFIGRSQECETIALLLAAVRAGESATLVLRGEPGVGKTALLDHTIHEAGGFRVARVVGMESESELPFAAVHQLCGRMLDRFGGLPGPQRDALEAAFGLAEGGSPDRFLVGLAVLSLLADVARSAPLLCVVDDAQWLDDVSAQTLAFVARRLYAESVAIVFASRTNGCHELSGLPQLVVGGLTHEDAIALLATVVPGRLDERVRDRIVAETQGNPLAILELTKGVTTTALAGGFGLNRMLPLSDHIEETFRSRLSPLPADTQQLLLLASAEPLGDPALLWRAAAHLGIDAGAAAPAEAEGLVEFDALVRFRHPLVRSATYQRASVEDRHLVHAALAEATDPRLDPDRRAWHRAQAAAAPDEELAAELERSASRAQARGGLAAAAAFLERAAALTPDPSRRAERLYAAAKLKNEAGSPLAAAELLAKAEAGPLEPLLRALLERLRAQIEFRLRRGSAAPAMFLEAAKMLQSLDGELARDTYLEAIYAALYAGKLGPGGGPRGAAMAARVAPPPPTPPRVSDLLLDGLAAVFTEGYASAVPILRRVQDAVAAGPCDIQYAGLACHAAGLLGTSTHAMISPPVRCSSPAMPERWPCCRPL